MNAENWSPEKERALKALIRKTIDLSGDQDPDVLPHRVRERIKGRATGDLDIDAYVREVLAERARSGR